MPFPIKRKRVTSAFLLVRQHALGFLKGTDGENRFGLDPLKLQSNRSRP